MVLQFILQQSVSMDQPLTLEDVSLTMEAMGTYAGIAFLACGIVLGIVLMIIGRIFGAVVGFGGAFVTMALYALAACGATFAAIHFGQVGMGDREAMFAQFGQLGVMAGPYGLKALLLSQVAGFVVLTLSLGGFARDNQGDRASLGAILFVAIIMTVLGVAAFYGINYGLLQSRGL